MCHCYALNSTKLSNILTTFSNILVATVLYNYFVVSHTCDVAINPSILTLLVPYSYLYYLYDTNTVVERPDLK